jgi:hypothetical protein
MGRTEKGRRVDNRRGRRGGMEEEGYGNSTGTAIFAIIALALVLDITTLTMPRLKKCLSPPLLLTRQQTSHLNSKQLFR